MDVDVSESSEVADDVVLRVNGTNFKCQKHLLIDASDYFQGMFSSNMRESTADLIELKETKPEVIKLLVASLTDDPEVTEDNVYELLEASVIYQFKDMLKSCCDYLEETLCHSNCLTIMCVADMFTLSDLFNRAKTHALWYFEDVAKESEMTELSEEQIIDYLSNTNLNSTDEWIVFEAVCSWFKQYISDVSSLNMTADDNRPIKMDTDNLSVVFRSVLQENGTNNPLDSTSATLFCKVFQKCVHLDMMCQQQLKRLLKHPLVVGNDDVKKMVQQTASSKRKSSFRVRNSVNMVKVSERKSPRSILCFGGHLCSTLPCVKPDECEGVAAPKELLWFSPEACTFQVDTLGDDSNSDWGENSLRMIGCQITLVDKEVFVTGGEAVLGRNTWQYAVTVFNCITRRWRCAKDLRQPRRHHAACAVDGTTLFLIGGFGRFRKIMNTVESYDVETDKWSDHPVMLQPEFSASVAVCNNSIYVFKTQIQKYDLGTKVWSFIKIDQPISSNVNFALTFGNSIYLCCKFNKTLRLFQPDSKKCQEVGHFQHECKGCAVLHGKIYWFEDYSNSPTVECYDPREKSFSVVGKMKNCFLTGEVITVPKYPTFHPSVLA